MLKILKIKACSGLSDSKVPTLSRCRHIETLKLALQVDDGIDFTNKCKASEIFSQLYFGGRLIRVNLSLLRKRTDLMPTYAKHNVAICLHCKGSHTTSTH